MAAHDLHHLYPVRRTASRRSDQLGRFAEELRPDCGGCHHAQTLHDFGAVVVEPMNGGPRTAKRLSRPYVNRLTSFVWSTKLNFNSVVHCRTN
jgi:hypothetical protein